VAAGALALRIGVPGRRQLGTGAYQVAFFILAACLLSAWSRRCGSPEAGDHVSRAPGEFPRNTVSGARPPIRVTLAESSGTELQRSCVK